MSKLIFDSVSNSFLRGGRRNKKSKSKKNLRSQMLKVIMPKLSGKYGEQLQQAIYQGDGAKAERVLRMIAKEVREEVDDK